MGIESMGHFTAIGMRIKVDDPEALIINTCAGNDTSTKGSPTSWVWANPTNRAFTHHYADVTAVSVEALWQGCKIFTVGGKPDQETLNGAWRRGKGRRPIGSWAGLGRPLLITPGAGRREIYLPAYGTLIATWLRDDPEVLNWVAKAHNWPGPVYLRDHDTGRGVDRAGPMSHAWVLAQYLNTGDWPA